MHNISGWDRSEFGGGHWPSWNLGELITNLAHPCNNNGFIFNNIDLMIHFITKQNEIIGLTFFIIIGNSQQHTHEKKSPIRIKKIIARDQNLNR